MATSGTSEAKAKVSLESSAFEKGAKAITAAANAMSKAVTAAMAATGVALLAALGAKSVSGVVNSIEAVLDLGESTANAGRKAYLAAGQFYAFSNAVEKGLKFSTVADMLADNADVLNRSASVFRDVSIKLWFVGEKIKGFWLGLVDRLAPVLSKLLDGALAYSLVSAGQSFGDAIAKALKVIYQMASDGTLWGSVKMGFKLAFDYAGERFIWLGKIGFDIIKAMLSKSFVDGVDSGFETVWNSVEKFTDHIKKELENAFVGAIASLMSGINKALDMLDNALFITGQISAKTLNNSYKYRHYGDAAAGQLPNADTGKPGKSGEGKPFLDTLSDILDKNKFSPSADLAKEIEDFNKAMKDALAKYDVNEKAQPTKTFENNTRREAFGADSLTAIGAGGGVYLGLSVLDVNKAQLQELREIKSALIGQRPQNNSFSIEANNVRRGISRAMTSSVVE